MNYIFNSDIGGIEKVDLFLFIGINPRKEAAIINAQIGNRVRNGKAKL